MLPYGTISTEGSMSILAAIFYIATVVMLSAASATQCGKKKKVPQKIEAPPAMPSQSTNFKTVEAKPPEPSKPKEAPPAVTDAVPQQKPAQPQPPPTKPADTTPASIPKVENSIEGAADKNKEKDKSEKTIVQMLTGAVANVFKRHDDATQNTGSEKEKQEDVLPYDKVKREGNLDEIAKEKKALWDKEVEEMKSTHEMEKEEASKSKKDGEPQPERHVKIAETKCKLYETNDQPTLDDEAEDQLI